MSDERLDTLIASHFHGLLSPAERTELEDRLQHSAADRAHFWKEAEMHALLHDTLQANLSQKTVPFPPDKRVSRRFPWSSLLWAAAGIVFGMFGASMLFAYTGSRITAKLIAVSTLQDGGFEKQNGHIAAGFPKEFGVWSGDQAETCPTPAPPATASSVAAPGHALRFIQAEREPILPYAVGASCDVLQLIDLRPFKAQAVSEEAFLEMSVRFLDQRPQSGEPMRFLAALHLFSGSPEAISASWPKSQTDAKGVSLAGCDSSGGQPQHWHTVSLRALFPPEADFGVVQLIAHRLRYQGTTPAVFKEQFADDVRVTLRTHPRIPIRQANSLFPSRDRSPISPAILSFPLPLLRPIGPLPNG